MVDGSVNNAEIVACLINRGDNIVEGIASMSGAIEGSICALVSTAEGVYAADSGNKRPCRNNEAVCDA